MHPDELRHDPVMGAVLGQFDAKRGRCAPLGGKSMLNRLGHSTAVIDRYRRIVPEPSAIRRLFELLLNAHARPPKEIVLDPDATDDPLARHQEGRFFHG